MTVSEEQQFEIDKYETIYRQHHKYRMGERRRDQACLVLASLALQYTTYLDVGCGRGEMLRSASHYNFHRIEGVEACEFLCNEQVKQAVAWDLPYADNEFEVVSMLDVIEHLLPGDDERACRELDRVSSRAVFLTANNKPSNSLGVELHVNRRMYETWDSLFREWFSGEVTWMDRGNSISELWLIRK